MISIIKRNLLFFASKNNGVFLIIIVILLCLSVVIPDSFLCQDELLKIMFGFKLSKDIPIFFLTISLLIQGYFIYIALFIISYDFKYSPEVIWTRINVKKWIISSLSSLIIWDMIIYCVFIVLFIINASFNHIQYNILTIYSIIIPYLFIEYILQLIVINLSLFLKQITFLVTFLVIFLIGILFENNMLVITINSLWILVLMIIILSLFSYFSYKQQKNKLLEGGM